MQTDSITQPRRQLWSVGFFLKYSRERVALLAVTLLAIHSGQAAEKLGLKSNQIIEEKPLFQRLSEKVRIRTFTEYLTPAISGMGVNVPSPEGTAIQPTFAFNIFWIDYEFAKNWKALYHQRFLINYTDPGLKFTPRNPRFALRRVNVFNVAGLNTTYDLYVQPGTSPEAFEGAGRSLEIGFRTTHSYDFARSSVHIGATTEITSAYSRGAYKKGMFNDYYGWFSVWGSYDLSPKFATQHYFTVNFMHDANDPILSILPDLPMPYVQNGISMSVNSAVWISVFVNNYAFVTPTLRNTWASLWLSFTIL